ncbi:MAG: DKNYY domain-containing protein [Bacteroidota bacterium]
MIRLTKEDTLLGMLLKTMILSFLILFSSCKTDLNKKYASSTVEKDLLELAKIISEEEIKLLKDYIYEQERIGNRAHLDKTYESILYDAKAAEPIKKQELKQKKIAERTRKIRHRKHIIDSINNIRNWIQIREGLWRDINGELGIKTIERIEKGIDIERYITCCEGKSLKYLIDTTSFKFLGSSFYKDKNHVFTHFDMADGGIVWILEEADVSTFKVIGDCYAKDKNNIYGERAMAMDSVDYRTFKTKKGIGCYAKDKNGYYFWGEKVMDMKKVLPKPNSYLDSITK